jgi:2-polyprenyl-3-methyl-5-hydroxy-6-metoxy-1,4-benzoquinol methylase
MSVQTDPWTDAKSKMVALPLKPGPWLSWELQEQPEHLAFVLARYRAAAALIGNAQEVLEVGCGEGIGAGILAKGRDSYIGVDSDRQAVITAVETHLDDKPIIFGCQDVLRDVLPLTDAIVMLDVVEHIEADDEDRLMAALRRALRRHGVLAVGTPSANAAQYASPVAAAGHVNNFSPDRLRELMEQHFRLVQMLFMQDTSVHFGHPGMAHYLLAVGIGPR